MSYYVVLYLNAWANKDPVEQLNKAIFFILLSAVTLTERKYEWRKMS